MNKICKCSWEEYMTTILIWFQVSDMKSEMFFLFLTLRNNALIMPYALFVYLRKKMEFVCGDQSVIMV